ncbi:MAG: DUF6647 family protein [Rhizomicrobium sp.]
MKIIVYATLFSLGTAGFSSAQAVRQNDVPILPIVDSYEVRSQVDPTRPTQALLTNIVVWLSANFDLPAIQSHPRVEFVSPATLATIRREDKDDPADRGRNAPAYASVEATHQREVVALYDSITQTIFLSDVWTGTTPTEQSILVHEMVHHLQDLGKLKFECPRAREKVAYMAQDQWLRRFGKSLEMEFEVDMFTILVASACMN